MRKDTERRPAGQLVAGLSLIGFPLAGLVASGVGPAEPADAAGLAEVYATNGGAVYAAALLFAVSAVLAGAAAVGLARLLRPRVSLLGHVGVGYLFVAAFGAMGWASAQLVLASAARELQGPALVALFRSAESALLVLLPLQLGVVVGAVLLAVALRRAGVIPMWLLVLELVTVAVVAVVQATDLATTTIGPVATWALALVFYGYLGWHALRADPWTWAHPAPAGVIVPPPAARTDRPLVART